MTNYSSYNNKIQTPVVTTAAPSITPTISTVSTTEVAPTGNNIKQTYTYTPVSRITTTPTTTMGVTTTVSLAPTPTIGYSCTPTVTIGVTSSVSISQQNNINTNTNTNNIDKSTYKKIL